MSTLTLARDAVFEAIEVAFTQPIAGYTFTGRVHRTQPAKLAAPCVFMGPSSGQMIPGDRGARAYVVSFPLWVIYDGTKAAQVDGVEEVLGRLADACLAAQAAPIGHVPSDPPGEVTGVTTPRAAVLTVELGIRRHSFCNPNPLEAASV